METAGLRARWMAFAVRSILLFPSPSPHLPKPTPSIFPCSSPLSLARGAALPRQIEAEQKWSEWIGICCWGSGDRLRLRADPPTAPTCFNGALSRHAKRPLFFALFGCFQFRTVAAAVDLHGLCQLWALILPRSIAAKRELMRRIHTLG